MLFKLMLVQKKKVNVTHHIDVTIFYLRRDDAQKSTSEYALVANVHCVERIKF